jgi:hypothetical protein
MPDPFALLPPPVFAEEARTFTHIGGAEFPLAFRVIPGPVHDTRVDEMQEKLAARFVQRGEPISFPGFPPVFLSGQLCEYFALLLVTQVPPKVEPTTEGGITQDLTGLGYKPYNVSQWAEMATRAPEVLWAILAFVRVLESRAVNAQVPRYQVATAYQKAIPDGLDPDAFVDPSEAGISQPDGTAGDASGYADTSGYGADTLGNESREGLAA